MTLHPQEDQYKEDSDEDDSFMETEINRGIYQYDSDEGETSFYRPPKRARKHTSRQDEITDRRKTLPSAQTYIPTRNGWE